MKVDVLLGLQWGDEGKGKIIDVLTPKYDIIARFQGGPNAGHTIEFEGQKHVLHLIPSGIFHRGKMNLQGNGMVICPIDEKKEIEYVRKFNPDYQLVIADGAQIILPTHRLLDKAMEAAKGNGKIGSTLKGIGPTYTDKISRCGLRVGDILNADFKKKYQVLKKKHLKLIALENYVVDDVCMQNLIEEEKTFFRAIRFMKKMQIVNSAYWINEQLDGGKSILAEGAQGTLLDVDHGDFPFVTSSNTTIGGVCTGLGIAANRIGKVYGLFKAYCTRVGSGPFPSELGAENSANWCATKKIEDENAHYPNVSINDINTFFRGIALRRKGSEFGATTGRLRRCGWLDIPKLKYACMINGVTDLVISKADVLIGCHTIEVCTSNKNENLHVYRHFDGWMECTLEDINFKKYLTFIEEETKLPIRIISVGPDREQVIIREK